MTTPTPAQDAQPSILRRPSVVKQDDEYDDHPAALFAFTAHGFDTDLTPFYSAAQLKEAMQAAWTASRLQALEEAANELETLSKPSALLLAAGEMTAQEMRTARAIAARFVAALRAMKETK